MRNSSFLTCFDMKCFSQYSILLNKGEGLFTISTFHQAQCYSFRHAVVEVDYDKK